MTRTGIAPKLNQHKPEPFVEVHPIDATLYGLVQNSLAKIESHWGSMLARVQITDSQQLGNIFVPMHWTQQLASQGRMGALVNPEVDPISKQPECKHTPVSIKAYHPAWQGFILSRQELAFSELKYWVKVKGAQFYRYELAGDCLVDDWRNYMNHKLSDAGAENAQWQEYQDSAKGSYRAARFIDNHLETVVFIATDNNLPGRSWLSSLFVQSVLTLNERKALLSGRSPQGFADVGAIVCACFNVGEKTLQAAIKEQALKTHQQVGVCLKAGTNCGSCVPEIKALLAAL
jgi:assimilatory nitrate reductase catalytic subunit